MGHKERYWLKCNKIIKKFKEKCGKYTLNMKIFLEIYRKI